MGSFRRRRGLMPCVFASAFTLWLVCLATVISAQAQRQHAVVNVRVSDSLTEDPIAMADVQLRTVGHGDFSQRGFTDSSGRINFNGVERGSYNLLVEKDGYVPAREYVDVRPGAAESYFILLTRRTDSRANDVPGTPVAAAALEVPAAARKEYVAGVRQLKDDPAKSTSRFLKAIEKYPGYSEAYTMLGLAYMRQKQSEAAMKALSKAIELSPRVSLARTLRGKLYREAKKFAEAETELLESIRLDSQAWDAPYELAFCYYYMGKLDKALEYARRAHDLPQAASATHLLLVDLYMRAKDPQAALRELEEFAKADPQSPFMPRVQQAINQLRTQKQN